MFLVSACVTSKNSSKLLKFLNETFYRYLKFTEISKKYELLSKSY